MIAEPSPSPGRPRSGDSGWRLGNAAALATGRAIVARFCSARSRPTTSRDAGGVSRCAAELAELAGRMAAGGAVALAGGAAAAVGAVAASSWAAAGKGERPLETGAPVTGGDAACGSLTFDGNALRGGSVVTGAVASGEDAVIGMCPAPTTRTATPTTMTAAATIA